MENLENEVVQKGRDVEASERRSRDELKKVSAANRNLEQDLSESRGLLAKFKKDNIELKNHIITLE